MKQHQYEVQVNWTGNDGEGTKTYRGYRRDHTVCAAGKPEIPGSSDPVFRGDRERYNPEELLVASLSACHMLWYLHLAADNGIVVVEYRDEPSGTMLETDDGAGKFSEVTLRPTVTARAPADEELAAQLHERAHEL